MNAYLHTKKAHSSAHSTAFRIQDSPYVPHSTATKVHNITHTSTCSTNSAWLMHSRASAYKTDHILSCSVVIKLQPPTDFSMHINMHYTPMQHYTHPTAFHNLPQSSYAQQTQRCKFQAVRWQFTLWQFNFLLAWRCSLVIGIQIYSTWNETEMSHYIHCELPGECIVLSDY